MFFWDIKPIRSRFRLECHPQADFWRKRDNASAKEILTDYAQAKITRGRSSSSRFDRF